MTGIHPAKDLKNIFNFRKTGKKKIHLYPDKKVQQLLDKIMYCIKLYFIQFNFRRTT